MAQINIGDRVLCYSCEKCRIERRPRDKSFEGVVTEIKGNIVTVRHDDGHKSYNDFRTLEVVKSISDFTKTPFVDSERIFKLGLDLAKGYKENSREDIGKAAKGIQAYIDEGGDIDFDIPEEYEDYKGNDYMKLSQQYILRVLRDRYCDTDEDQQYIRTGLKPTMRISQPVQLSLNF